MNGKLENSQIYFSFSRYEADLADAVEVLDGTGLPCDEWQSIRELTGLGIVQMAAMAKRMGVEHIRNFAARHARLDELYMGQDDEWLALYDELENELAEYAQKPREGARYFALCPYCNGEVIADTDVNLAGRVIGLYCDDCGTAFYTRVPLGNNKKTIRKSSDTLQEVILKALTGDELPATIRHIFYVLAGNGYVAKDDKGYNKILYQLGIMRDDGQVPFNWLADNTRWHIRPRTYHNLEGALVNTTETYRRALWDTQNAYVEIWCEKDAIASIIASVTRPYDVPLFVARGFSSTTPLYNIAKEISEMGRPAYIYHFGDFDPSGVLAFDAAARKLQEFVDKFGGQVTLERATVTEEQIAEWNLPTRETKKSTHSGKWGNKPSCELDVIPSSKLRELARDCIEKHIDQGELERIKQIEREEQLALQNILFQFRASPKLEAVK